MAKFIVNFHIPILVDAEEVPSTGIFEDDIQNQLSDKAWNDIYSKAVNELIDNPNFDLSGNVDSIEEVK